MSSTALRSVFRVSPIFALLWEQWRVTRGPVILALVFGAGTLIPLGIGERPLAGHIFIGLFAFPITLFCIAVAGVFSLTRRRPGEELCLGFPQPEGSLPVRRRVLVWTVLGYRLGVVGTVALVLGGLSKLLPENALFEYPILPYYNIALVSMCCFSYLMAISWTLGKRSAGAALAVMFTLAAPVSLGTAWVTHIYHWPPALVKLAFIAACCGIAARGAQQRTGRWISAGAIAAAAAAWTLPARTIRFEDGDSAQCWYEWRKRGLVLPLLAVGILVALAALYGVILIVLSLGNDTAARDAVIGQAAVYVCDVIPRAWLFASGITGFIFLYMDWRAFQSKRAGAIPVQAAPSSLLTMARLRMSLYSTALAYGIGGAVLACAMVYLRFWARRPFELEFLFTQEHALLLSPLIVFSYLVLAWCLLWSPLILLAAACWMFWALMPGAILYQALGYGNDIGQVVVFRLVALGVPAVCAALAAVHFGVRCYRRELLPRPILHMAAAFSAAILLALFVTPFIAEHGKAFSNFVEMLEYALPATAVSTLPALTVFTQAAWVDRLRYHR